MDVEDEELLSFWRGLNINGVRYIMVGGFAVRFNGFNRTTEDIDMWLEDTLTNRQNLRKTFNELGYGDFPSIETMQFIPGWTSFNIAFGIELDIMTEMKGLESQSFDEYLRKTRIADFDGVKVPFLHINDLIANKKAVFRPKDQIDLLELEKIKKIQDEADRQKNG
jgi:predicted nucleotidyltransferase